MTKLTPEQRELLVLISEECSEVIQAASKLLRFGDHDPWRTDPKDPNYDRTEQLETELGDVVAVTYALDLLGIANLKKVKAYAKAKVKKLLLDPRRLPLSRGALCAARWHRGHR